MAFRLSNLFKSKQSVSQTSTAHPSVLPHHANDKLIGETYQQWGMRMCATVLGSHYALAPYLHNIYQKLYTKQATDQAAQEEFKNQIRTEIEQKINTKRFYNQQINEKNQDISDLQHDIVTRETEIVNLKQSEVVTNKDEKLKMNIGICILVPLTCYLLLFYSSTFYSAFLANNGEYNDAIGAMFNSQAFALAWRQSIAVFTLMLLFPIIFMGLGYILHFFTQEQGGFRFVKVSTILAVTFTFDSILAYKIGKNIYNSEITDGLLPIDSPEYSLGLAISDESTWAVIFCGFIAYMIWGFVFDMTLSAHSKLDSNRTHIAHLTTQIEQSKNNVQNLREDIHGLQQNMTALDNEISSLNHKLTSDVNIHFSPIKQEITNFYSGWITQMGVLGSTEQQMSEASAVYTNTINDLFR